MARSSTVNSVFAGLLAVGIAASSVGAESRVARGTAGSVAAAAIAPRTIASWQGHVSGVTQNGTSVAWCRSNSSTEIRLWRRADHSQHAVHGYCPWDASIAFTHDSIAWGGYEEVRCVDTHWAIYAPVNGRAKTVRIVSHDCLGWGSNFRGLASDGSSVFYAVAAYTGDTSCEDNVALPCSLVLAGGGVYRINGIDSKPVSGFPPAADIAAAAGRIATVEPLKEGTIRITYGGPAGDYPRAATNGLVQIRRSADASLISSFRPTGIVRDLALSSHYAVVLVQQDDAFRVEWYSPATGKALGTLPVPANFTFGATWPGQFLSASGHLALLADGTTITLIDLQTGSKRQLWKGPRHSEPFGLSINDTHVVWGTNDGKTARVLELTLPR